MTLDQLRASFASHQATDEPQRRFDLEAVGSSPPQPSRAPDGATARPAAVLALIYPGPRELHLALTRRTASLALHASQISLPGGTPEPGDDSLADTALRETEEELAVPRHRVELIATLPTVYIPPTNYLVTPFVGIAPRRPEMRPNPDEVDELVEVPLSLLARPGVIERERWTLRGHTYLVPFYRYGEHRIWGATARILSMLGHAIALCRP